MSQILEWILENGKGWQPIRQLDHFGSLQAVEWMTEEGRFLIVEKELKAIPLPAIYKREGKECYYDTYRKKLIEITPEETVRQRVAAYFENECGVPKEMISLEVPIF